MAIFKFGFLPGQRKYGVHVFHLDQAIDKAVPIAQVGNTCFFR